MSCVLRLTGVSKSYGALKVTDNISFAIEQGETYGILGPNGAGKTTLFNLLAATCGRTPARSNSMEPISASWRRIAACGRYWALVSGAPALRRHDGIREPAGGRHLWRRTERT